MRPNLFRSSFAGVLLIVACYSPGGVGVQVEHSLVAGRELQTANTSDLYNAIEKVRPMFLISRGPTSLLNQPPDAFLVIVNGTVMGGLDELRGIDVRLVQSVRRLSAADVYQITGRSAPSGGIEVRLGQ